MQTTTRHCTRASGHEPRTLRQAVLAVALALAATPAVALVWSQQAPPGAEAHDHGGGHAHGRRGPALYLHAGEGARARMWTPELQELPLTFEGARAALPRTGFDNYHLLLATREGDGLFESALRYLPRHGRPSGRSPAELLAAPKVALEIVPEPLPREHRRYLSGTEALFRIRFEGRPLAGAAVVSETSNGSRLHAVSDAEGRVRLILPEDFAAVRPGRDNNAPAELRLSVSHQAGRDRHRTTLSHDYHANPAHWQSGTGGLAAALAGFVAGIGALRIGRRKGEGQP